MKKGKDYSEKERLDVLKEAQEKGVKVTLSKYGIFPATYYYWKKQLSSTGSLSRQAGDKDLVRTNQRLKKEVETLKLLLAEEQLSNRLQQEMLKKKYPDLNWSH